MTVRLRNLFRALVPLGMAGFLLLGSTPSAHALLTLDAVETTGLMATLNVFDNGPGDSNPLLGIISLGNSVTPITFGDFSVLGSVSTSNSPGGLLAQLTSNSLSVTNNTGVLQSIVLRVSDTGFTNPFPPQFDATGSGTFNVVSGSGTTSVSGSTAHVLGYADYTNTLFGTQNTIQDYTKAAGSGSTDSYSNTVVGIVPVTIPASPYSMTVRLDFSLAGNNILSSRGNAITAMSAVPEPATLMSLAIGLGLLGLGARVRRGRQSS